MDTTDEVFYIEIPVELKKRIDERDLSIEVLIELGLYSLTEKDEKLKKKFYLEELKINKEVLEYLYKTREDIDYVGRCTGNL